MNSLFGRFEKHVKSFPNKYAVKFNENEKITYKNLYDLALKYSFKFKKLDFKIGDVIFISSHKTIETFGLILASINYGLIYSIIDEDIPKLRLKKICKRTKPKVIFEVKNEFSLKKISNLKVLKINSQLENCKKIKLKTKFNTPVYLMFTSGSTGEPKAVVISSFNILNFIEWTEETYGVNHKDIILNLNPIYFDNSVFDIYSSIFNGATLVPIRKDELSKPKILFTKVYNYKCSTWFSVPSLIIFIDKLYGFQNLNNKYLKRIIFGGEGFPKKKLVHIYEYLKNNTKFYNVYGPTECTCICSSYQIQENDFNELEGIFPIGEISDKFSYKIGNKIQSSKDLKGELYLSGDMVGYGYYKNKELTKNKFSYEYYEEGHILRTYKTGDIVKKSNKDGKIYFIGREDSQIKHLGYRIELFEIEQKINSIKNVGDALVLHHKKNDISCLTCFYTSNSIKKDEIVKKIKKKLPSYMIPNFFIRIDRLPLNKNGKYDRKLLLKSL